MTTSATSTLPLQQAAETFLHNWVTAWNRRDAPALALLHAEDAVTINRYGTVLRGRQDSAQALAFLLSPAGPFGDTQFPPMHIVELREVSPGVAIVQATWGAPVLGADGNIVPGQFNDMILSYTLLQQPSGWLMTQVDGHNIEKMDLPFSSPDQKA